MTQATLILPYGDGHTTLHHNYLAYIAKLYGGFTATPANGGWINDAGQLVCEPVLSIMVAVDESEYSNRLYWLAHAAALDFDQDCIFLQFTGEDAYYANKPTMDESRRRVAMLRRTIHNNVPFPD